MLWKWTKWLCLGLVSTIALSLLLGVLYQAVSTKIDKQKFPPIGKMVDLGGYRLHLYGTGQGGPTVVLESGLCCQALDWTLVQQPVSKFTHVCSYDRAGYGWSDESPQERTSLNMVEELHALLARAKVPKPYILVGHSLGGVNARLYASRYPDEVAGVILVDSAHEDLYGKLPKAALPNEWLLMLMSRTGAVRLLRRTGKYWVLEESLFGNFPADLRHIRISHLLACKDTKTALRELSGLETGLNQLKESGGYLGDKPLVVISATQSMSLPGTGILQADLESLYAIFSQQQKDLLTKSKNSRHVLAEKSDHNIHLHQPEVIVEEIGKLVSEIRAKTEALGAQSQRSTSSPRL